MIQNLKKEKKFNWTFGRKFIVFPLATILFVHDIRDFYLMIGLIKYAEVSHNDKQYQALLKKIINFFHGYFEHG